MTKKIFAMFLAVLMVVSMLPTSVFAANECPGEENASKHSTSNCDYTVVKVTDPTCGTAGHTSYKCNVCGYTFAETTAPATGEHSFVAGEGKAPTCIEDGYEAGLECEVCGLVKPGKEIPKLDKDATSCEWEVVAGYDCKEGGRLIYECAFCGASKKGPKVEAGQHIMGYAYVTPISATEAVIPCLNPYCGYYEVATILNAHTCAEYMFKVNAVAKTCATSGLKEHYECRVCNKLYKLTDDGFVALTEKEIGKLTIPASHNTPNATCADTLVTCLDCGKKVNPGVAHDIDWEIKSGEADKGAVLVPATCSQPGYIYDVCANCSVRDLKILDAIGHREVTVTVPATCGTFAYTFTYCTRLDCDATKMEGVIYEGKKAVSTTDELGMVYSLMVPALEVTADLAEMVDGFLFGMDQEKLGKTLYFAGEMDGYYLATTADPEEAVTVYFEQLENYRSRYLLYFFNEEGEKTYIDIQLREGYLNKANVVLVEEPVNYFTWNSEIGFFTVELGEYEFYLGTHGTYKTFSASNTTEFPAEENFTAAPYAFVGDAGVSLLSIEFNVDGGYNPEKHAYAPEMGSLDMPTCDEAGSVDMVCAYCQDTVTVELPAGCLSIAELTGNANLVAATEEDLAAAKIKGAPSANPTCTKAGYKYYKCTECEELIKITTAAPLGHDMVVEHDDSIRDADGKQIVLNHTNRTGYIGIDCVDIEECGHAIKLQTVKWDYSDTLFDTLEDAIDAHDDCILTFVNLARPGNCDVAGIEIYSCSGCGKNVRVKQWLKLYAADGKTLIGKYATGEHVGHREINPITGKVNHQDPTCTAAGWHTTYECPRCGEVIGNENINETEDLKKLAHTWYDISALVEYEAAPCDTPNYNNIKYMCLTCGQFKNDGTKLITTVVGDVEIDMNIKLPHNGTVVTNCKGNTLEMYLCHCGEIHIRSLGSYDHKWFVVEQTKDNKGSIWSPATCYKQGWYTVKCEYCGVTTTLASETVEHVNAAGEKFTDSCLDKVTDRHCVVCCDAFKHDYKGNTHDCYETENVDGKDVYICLAKYHVHEYCTDACEEECSVTTHCNGYEGDCYKVINDGCIIPTFHHYELAENRGSTCVQDAHSLYICADCEGEKMVGAEVNKDIEPAGTVISEGYIYFYGHKPMAGEAIFANYTYLDVKYQEVIINDDGEFELDVERIADAQFIEYKAPTYNADGYAKFECEHCETVVEQVLPKLSGMGFELDIKNANGQDGFTYGSLIEVTVSINGNDVDVNNFTFDAFSIFEFVGFETLNNELFHLTVTDPASDNEIVIEPTDILDDVLAFDKVTVTGVAANTAAGKMQNVNINEKTELVKLFFRIDDEFFAIFGMEDVEFMEFVDGEVNKWISGKTTETIYEGFIGQEGVIDVKCHADFDGNGYATVNDLSLALTLLTGEHPTGATYDVTVDMNKDGVITLEDLSIAHNLYVDNLTLEEVFYMGMSEAEIELFEGQKPDYCVHCGYKGVTETTNYCPNCGRNPHAK